MKPFRYPRVAVAVGSFLLVAGCGPKKTETAVPPAGDGTKPGGEAMPAPDPAPVTEGDVTVFYTNGLKVIHKRTPGKTTLAARWYFLGGVAHLGSGNAGLERLTLFTSTRGGTAKHSRAEYVAELERVAATVNARVGRDASSVTLGCLVRDFDIGFDLFLEAALHPIFDPAEITLQRERHLAAIASERDTPDSHISIIARELFWKGHPYEIRQLGTKENVERFTRDDLVAYHKGLIKTDEMLLVLVGDVSTDKVMTLVREASDGLPRGKPRAPLSLPPAKAAKPELETHKRELPTHYVLGYFDGPRFGAADHPAALVTFDILRHRLFEEVRTKKSLTYAVSAGTSPGAAGSGYLYVTAVKPNDAVAAILAEVDKMAAEPLPDKELADTISVFITRHFRNLETAVAQIGMLGSGEIFTGDWHWGVELVSKLRAVTPADVQKVAAGYIKNIHFAVLGEVDGIDEKLFRSR